MRSNDVVPLTFQELLGESATRALIESHWPHRVFHQLDAARPVLGSPGLAMFDDPATLLRAAPWREIRLFVPGDDGRKEHCLVTPQQAAKLLRRGVTLEIYHMERDAKMLFGLAESLEIALGLPKGACEVQAFVSREGDGFPLHFDQRDVITVQLKGEKRWIVSPPDVLFPTKGLEAGSPIPKELSPYWPLDLAITRGYRPRDETELRMNPGAVLYVPRGHWHRTATVGERGAEASSISLAFVLATPSLVEIVTNAIRTRLVREAAWRETVPIRLERDHPARRTAEARLDELLRGLPKHIGALTAEAIFDLDSKASEET